MPRPKRQFELALVAALGAVVILPTAFVLALGMSALSEARRLFESQVRDTAARTANTLVSEAIGRAELEIASARADIQSFAAAGDPAERLGVARTAGSAEGLALVAGDLRVLYPKALPAAADSHGAPALERARRARFEEGSDAAEALYREIIAGGGEETTLALSALNELAQILVSCGRTDEALEVYRRLAESEGMLGELSLPLLAKFRMWELAADERTQKDLLDAMTVHALSAPAAQLRYYLGRLEGQGTGPEQTSDLRALLELRVADEWLARRAALAAARADSADSPADTLVWTQCGDVGSPALAAALRLESGEEGPAYAVVSLDLTKMGSYLDEKIGESVSPGSSISYVRAETGAQRDDSAFAAALAAPLDFWQLCVIAPGGDLGALAKARVRLLSWAVGLASLSVLGGFLLVVIWARRRARLARLQTDFVANVTHELKTPLTAIRSLAETVLLERLTEPSKRGEFLSGIVQESDRLARLINNVLDFSRIERGRVQPHVEEADLAGVIGEAVESFKAALPAEDETEISASLPDEPVPAFVDRDMIAGIVYNLLDNARKYSEPPRRIRVALSREGGGATLAVGDNGIGLTPGERRRVFRKFYRVDSSLSAGTQGAGLGLSLVQAYAKAHGGDVSVESEVGKGSTFTVRLPVREGEDELQGNDTGR